MKKIKLYYIELDKLNENIINNLPFIKEEDYTNANRFALKQNKLQHLISYYFKRKYLGDYSLNEYGKPISKGKYANLSHCDNLVIVGVSDCDIGVDIERVKPVKEELKRYVSSDIENEEIKSDLDFFKIWVAKESLIKCLGLTISKIKEVPSLPFVGKREYLGNTFYTKETKINDYLVAVTIKSDEDFELDISQEEIV